jgi:hypothetical protein
LSVGNLRESHDFGGIAAMREEKRKDRRSVSGDSASAAWRDELLANALELWLGASRLMTTVQGGPPQTSPPRHRRPARRNR